MDEVHFFSKLDIKEIFKQFRDLRIGYVLSVEEENGTIDNPFELGKKIGNELKSQGVSEIASNWREKLEEWNKQ